MLGANTPALARPVAQSRAGGLRDRRIDKAADEILRMLGLYGVDLLSRSTLRTRGKSEAHARMSGIGVQVKAAYGIRHAVRGARAC
jgi:hypothetical protein